MHLRMPKTLATPLPSRDSQERLGIPLDCWELR